MKKTIGRIGLIGLLGLMLAGCVSKPVNRSTLEFPPVKYSDPCP